MYVPPYLRTPGAGGRLLPRWQPSENWEPADTAAPRAADTASTVMSNPFSTVALDAVALNTSYDETPGSSMPQGGPMPGGPIPPAQKKTMFFHALFKVRAAARAAKLLRGVAAGCPPHLCRRLPS